MLGTSLWGRRTYMFSVLGNKWESKESHKGIMRE